MNTIPVGIGNTNEDLSKCGTSNHHYVQITTGQYVKQVMCCTRCGHNFTIKQETN